GDRLVAHRTRLRVAGPVQDAGYAVAAFVHRQLHALERSGRAVRVGRGRVAVQRFRAVVAGEQDERFVAEFTLVQGFQQPADFVVDERDAAVVDALRLVGNVGVHRRELIRRGDDLVRRVEAEE